MQRIRFNRRRVIFLIVAIISTAILVFLDQLTKKLFTSLYERSGDTIVIKDFFYFSYAENSGSAYGFLSDKSWGQLFFKILTPFALVGFIAVLLLSIFKGYKTLYIGILFVIAGTIGNFIDRLFFIILLANHSI